jgi:Tol biopolymer transport system component
MEPSEDVVPSWSLDGKWVYFASNRSGAWQVWKAPAPGGKAVQVTTRGGFAAFESPDAKYLYYAKGRSAPGLWRKPLDGGTEEPVFPELKAGFWGYWAVVQRGIYYFDDPGPNGRGVYYYDLKTHRIRLISAVENRPMVGDSAFAVAPDGSSILYTQIDQSGSDVMIANFAPE